MSNLVHVPSQYISLSSGFVYDSAWTIGLVLNLTSSALAQSGGGGRLEDFTYDSADVIQLTIDAMRRLSFQGVSVGGATVGIKRDLNVYCDADCLSLKMFCSSHLLDDIVIMTIKTQFVRFIITNLS